MKRVMFFAGGISVFLLALASTLLLGPRALAADGNFFLQVTPSPLVTTLKPGVPTNLELKIRNASTATEELKIEARRFAFDDVTGKVKLDETLAPDIAPWLSFPSPTFSIRPGEWSTQKIHVALPKESGFSYAFALVISRKDLPTATNGGHLLNGSVAVFTLLNVDRPGATRSVDLVSFKSSQQVYEFLPVTLDIRLKNTGNTIVQPYGNVYIQRNNNDAKPLKTLPVNDARAYLLPGSERSLTAVWADGFPVYQSANDTTGTQKNTLAWNFDQVSHFRFGRYTAKVVAVYNDGTRDVPITGEVSFWVIPWKAILLLLAIIIGLVVLFNRYVKARTKRAVKKALAAQKNV